MSSRAEIEQAVANLSPEEFTRFERWFTEERNRRWDRQMEADAEEGIPDFLLQEPSPAPTANPGSGLLL